ncbi:DUF2958 domain-containing protein [Sinorhizobium sp. BG8]|uniref:DUF2958 domain-containing protein n=1 Tax=Sinorhizobium sp. BG8 TaxID=2613773 RepID=UPI00193CA23A|nr:DUF2958 domain-containing protein [Sinorhizobium sp. BG8]QRM54711.1 DUF2958 domain-containing protein [Sinorhizobium sp. BG8]
MNLLPENILERLAQNNCNRDADHVPVVKFFLPGTNCVWVFTEIEPDGDTLFGLCDLGQGEPELGYASFSEMTSIRTQIGTVIERDVHWKGKAPMSEYARAARAARRIVEV